MSVAGKTGDESAGSAVERVNAWQARGEVSLFDGHRIHLYRQDGEGPLRLLLHGFPSSSYDWRRLIDGHLDGCAALAPDFLGFGLSAKPREPNSLLRQADIVEALLGELAPGSRVVICAHDMGTSVATELLARDIDGELSFDLRGALLFNGSIVLERASLTWTQRLLRSPLGPIASRLMNERTFRRQFGSLFSDEHPLSDAEAADQWELIVGGGGRGTGHLLINYLDERELHAERWHGAVCEWPGELRLLWGLEDPVATTEVLAALRELRPAASVTELAGVGHYPQIEVPGAVSQALGGTVEASL